MLELWLNSFLLKDGFEVVCVNSLFFTHEDGRQKWMWMVDGSQDFGYVFRDTLSHTSVRDRHPDMRRILLLVHSLRAQISKPSIFFQRHQFFFSQMFFFLLQNIYIYCLSYNELHQSRFQHEFK